MKNMEILNDQEEILHKNSINEYNFNDKDNDLLDLNSDKKTNNTISGINQYKSQENILILEKGSKVCLKKWIILVVCLIICLLISLIGSLVIKNVMWSLIIASPFGLGFFFELFSLICCSCGFHIVEPNDAIVFEFFGRYLGTLKNNGFWYGYPYASTRRVSLRRNQFNGNRLKVNERDGNPVELGIIVVWKIGDTAKAVFDVVDYKSFVEVQSEAAIRYIGCKYPYDPVVPGEISLRGGHEIINKELKEELEKRIKPAGIVIEDARVTEISYGSEVAQMMLQKQASSAASTAKETIVKGATSAVMRSLNDFEKYGCRLSDADKSKYIISMMNTLCMSSEVSKIMANNE